MSSSLLTFVTPAQWTLILSALIGIIGLLYYSIKIEPRKIDISRHDVYFESLPHALEGAVICQVADVHITAWERNAAAIARAIESVHADLYVLTGDQIYLDSGTLAFCKWFDALGENIQPAVAILGNAENKPYVRRDHFEEEIAKRNLPLLNNRTAKIIVRGYPMQIVGSDDPHTNHSDMNKAFEDAEPDEWTLLLTHSPDGVAELRGERVDLILCGHTHGGQIRIPLIGSIAQNTKKVRGLVNGWYTGAELSRKAKVETGNAKLYVSRGLGMSRAALRFNSPPELALFTLHRKSSN